MVWPENTPPVYVPAKLPSNEPAAGAVTVIVNFPDAVPSIVATATSDRPMTVAVPVRSPLTGPLWV